MPETWERGAARSERRRAPAVLIATALLAAQCLAVAAAAVGFATEIGQGMLNLAGQVFLVVLIAAAAVWIGVVALGLWAGRPWVRAAAVVIEMFAVILSIGFFTGGNPLLGAAFLIPAGGVLVTLFTQQTAEHLAGLRPGTGPAGS